MDGHRFFQDRFESEAPEEPPYKKATFLKKIQVHVCLYGLTRVVLKETGWAEWTNTLTVIWTSLVNLPSLWSTLHPTLPNT